MTLFCAIVLPAITIKRSQKKRYEQKCILKTGRQWPRKFVTFCVITLFWGNSWPVFKMPFLTYVNFSEWGKKKVGTKGHFKNRSVMNCQTWVISGSWLFFGVTPDRFLKWPFTWPKFLVDQKVILKTGREWPKKPWNIVCCFYLLRCCTEKTTKRVYCENNSYIYKTTESWKTRKFFGVLLVGLPRRSTSIMTESL